MAYTFNQLFTGLDPVVQSLLPTSFSVAALSVIDGVTSHNPVATQKDVLQALYNEVVSGSLG